jgi:hypothetical protein
MVLFVIKGIFIAHSGLLTAANISIEIRFEDKKQGPVTRVVNITARLLQICRYPIPGESAMPGRAAAW